MAKVCVRLGRPGALCCAGALIYPTRLRSRPSSARNIQNPTPAMNASAVLPQRRSLARHGTLAPALPPGSRAVARDGRPPGRASEAREARPGGRHGDAQRRARARLPVAIDTIGQAPHPAEDQLQVSLSESLACVPGVLSTPMELCAGSRAVGARLWRAGQFRRARRAALPGFIPATMPDGQGQTGSFSLVSANASRCCAARFDAVRQRLRRRDLGVYRGWSRHSAGNAQVDRRQLRTGTRSLKFGGQPARRTTPRRKSIRDRRLPRTQRRYSRSRQLQAPLRPLAGHRITLIGNSLWQPDAQDPLGLTHAQWLPTRAKRIPQRPCSTHARPSTSSRAGQPSSSA